MAWELLLEITTWLEYHPRPGLYLRQVDVPDVHSKFIEAHRGVLMELLDLVLLPEAIDQTACGVSQFARRYGFRDKPVRIRLRVLDPEINPFGYAQHRLLPGGLAPDITLDAESFARLDPPIARVFITENEINFLAFPQVKNSLVIFRRSSRLNKPTYRIPFFYSVKLLTQLTYSLMHCRYRLKNQAGIP